MDSYMAASVVEILRKLASQGRTVICTIHQPSSQIVEMFDKILLMAEGRTAFLGKVSNAIRLPRTPCSPSLPPSKH